MHSLAQDNSSSDRLRLIPRIAIGSAAFSILASQARSPTQSSFVGAMMLVQSFWAIALVYLVWVFMRTRKLVLDPHKLHPLDLQLCRWSGAIAISIPMVLFACCFLDCVNVPEDESIIPTLFGQLVYFSANVGFVLCIACASSPPSLGHIEPHQGWRMLMAAIVVPYAAVIMFMPGASVIRNLPKPP